ncbi:MAG: hypothetical protein IID32_11845, partial [Planctomycetes bacterium]|nr:hypothetical protein [Planctomycetota bacterium]
MKKLLITMMSLMLMFGVVASADAASSEDITVTVTITAGAADVSLLVAAWSIGSISEGSTPSTGPDFFSARNESNSPEDLTLTVGNS